MPRKACPVCGSEYFLTSKAEPRTVFRVNSDDSLQIVQEAIDQEIHHDAVCCGACSWKGHINQLVESHG